MLTGPPIDDRRWFERTASGHPHTGRQVATVGRIEAVPGAPNVVPGEVRATLEIRDLEMAKIGRVFAEIEARARAIEADREVTVAFEQFYDIARGANVLLRSLLVLDRE